jgi:hypothetical protein
MKTSFCQRVDRERQIAKTIKSQAARDGKQSPWSLDHFQFSAAADRRLVTGKPHFGAIQSLTA